ncbi:MAG: APHP domain-containing [Planctomycetota bacterium]|nr:MAG: APHP domain-containing [Planctomycetota bacterium]
MRFPVLLVLVLCGESLAETTVGGLELGCMDVGEVSVVTMRADALSSSYSADRGALVYRDHHVSEPFADVYVCVPVTLHGPAYYFSGVAVLADLASTSKHADARGFSSDDSILGQEFGHRWISYNIPRPVVADGRTTEAGPAGVLIDTVRDFSETVLPGDIVLLPGSGDFREFLVSTVSAHTLRFAAEVPGIAPEPSLPSGAQYRVRSHELVGRQQAHWSPWADTDGSYIDGYAWQDQGDGTFVATASTDRYGPWDLYFMGLKPVNELPSMFVIRDPQWILQGLVAAGTRRDFSPGQILAGTRDVSFQPRNFRVRWIIVTTLGSPVDLESVERIDQLRRDWTTRFQGLTLGPSGERRGSLTTIRSEERPDPVVARIDAPLRGGPGERFSFTLDLHNQSSTAATGFFVAVRTLPGPSWPLARLWVPGLGPHEILSRAVTITLPSASGLFASRAYQGSFQLQVTVDDSRLIPEAEEVHNQREVAVIWSPAVGSDLTSTTPTTAEPVSDGSCVYVARRSRERGSWIETIDPADPLRLRLRTATPAGIWIASIASGPAVLAAADVDGVRIYPTPLGPSATPVQFLATGPAFHVCFLGDVLYVSTQRGIDVFTGVGQAGRATVATTLEGDALGPMRVVNSRLYVPTPQGVLEYDVRAPSSPLLVRTLEAGRLTISAAVKGDTLFTVIPGDGVVAVRLASGERLSRLRANDVRRIRAIGEFLVADSGAVLGFDGSTLTFLGKPPFTESLLRVGEFQGWTVVADQGLKFFSPSGVTYRFVRGDANADGRVDTSDLVRILDVLYSGGTFAGLHDAFDVNDDGFTDVSDVVTLAGYLYQGGAPPPAPFPSEGIDPTPDGLGYVRPR